MSSPSVAAGVQLPAAEHVPPFEFSDGPDAIFLASGYGLVADEWQEHVLTAWLGVDADGQLTAARAGLAVPRQNGKNALIEMLELFKVVAQARRVLHTAHEVKTARKAFARLKYFFGDKAQDPAAQFPELNALVKEVRNTNGQEAIVLRNGGSVEFIARSKSSGRGFSVDDLVLDEAQELSEDALAALVPTLSASDNPQRILTGTPPGPTAVGEAFSRVRQVGLSGKDNRLCWMEWRAELDADPDDPEQVAKANPALGIRLLPETVSDERADMSEETFARERLGLWDTQSTLQVINPDVWAALGDKASEPLDPVCFAADITPDRQRGTIALAGRRTDGRLHIEVVQNERGTAWIVPRLLELNAKWHPVGVVVDPGSPAGSLIAELQEQGIEPVLTSTRDVGQACGAFYDMARDDKLRHLEDPRLTLALNSARKRPLGDSGAWAWHRKDATTDITPLVATTLALFGYQSRKPEPVKGLTRVTGRVRSY
jgi:phage terminase large subunit-like protein